MENTLKFLWSAFHVIVYFLGIMLLYQMNYHFNDLVDVTTGRIIEDNMVYAAAPINKGNIITKGELVSYLTEELRYDMEIIDQSNQYLILREEYSPPLIGLYSFTGEFYEKIYHYKQNGEISKIEFRCCE